MTEADEPRFAEILHALAALHDRKITPQVVDLYFKTLGDVSLEQFTNAASKLARELKFFPKPADVLEVVRGGTADSLALLAWETAWRAAGDVGAYHSPQFDDGTIHFVIRDMGGWSSFCRPDEAEWAWRKRFLELYAAYSARGAENPPELTGIADAHNRANGYLGRAGEPVRIGGGGQRRLTE